ncbi:glycosyltransferase family 39 protein [Candidatus Sumerlaeota bacterium]|nr:glycosyltransferase family 39 protein [Candidatus Sumerlaeota bacterium]
MTDPAEAQPTLDVSRTQALVLLAVGIVLAVVLQGFRARSLTIPTHDDAISYLAATGHQGKYEEDRPSERWAPAREWKSYWRFDRFWCFRTIGRDLARYDIHPPLYFWLLHVWIALVGVKLIAGPILNIVLNVLSSIVLYRAGRALRRSRGASAAAAVLWILSDTPMAASVETRQYCLLGLTVVTLCLALVRFVEGSKRSDYPLLSVVALCGLLTHYQFIVLLGISATAAAILLAVRRNYRRLVGKIVALGISAAAFVAMHPHFLLSFSRQRDQVEPFAWSNLPDRIERCAVAFLNLFAPDTFAWRAVQHRFVPTVALAAVAVAALWCLLGILRSLSRHRPLTPWLPVVVFFSTLAAIWTLYVFQRLPGHAMQTKYLMLFSPTAYLVVGQVLDCPIRWRRAVWVAVGVLVVGQAAISCRTTRQFVKSSRVECAELREVTAPLVVDTAARGILPVVLWHVQDDVPVYAESQKALLVRLPDKIEALPGFLYVSDLRYENSADKREAILKKFAEKGYPAQQAATGMFGFADVYVLKKKGPR